jgi:hypothetical protein
MSQWFDGLTLPDVSSVTDQATLDAAVLTVAALSNTWSPQAAGDQSPGKLALEYSDLGTERHTSKYRVLRGVNIYDHTAMTLEADRIAAGFCQALPPHLAVTGFRVYNALGVEVYATLLPSVHVGTHGTLGSLDSNSYTVTLTGRGSASGDGQYPGDTLTRFFPRRGYPDDRGLKFVDLSGGDLGLLAYAAALATSGVVWADFHGWKAGIRPTCPIQFNAAAQRRVGN